MLDIFELSFNSLSLSLSLSNFSNFSNLQIPSLTQKLTQKKNTNIAIIIYSNHELNYSSEYTFFDRYLHHKQPTMMMLLPNQPLIHIPILVMLLKKNQYCLSTHMDLHQTLLYLAYGGGGEKYMPKGLKTTTLVDYLGYEK